MDLEDAGRARVFTEKMQWTDWKGKERELSFRREVKSLSGEDEFQEEGDTASFPQFILLEEMCGRLEEIGEKIDKTNTLLAGVLGEKLE